MKLRRIGAAAMIVAAIAACGIDTAPDGARRTPPGAGPLIVFDVTRRPLPEIPQPNDVATFADPTSRTGRRIAVSTVSPTRLETNAREAFDELEGWGTFAPITVSFTRDAATPEGTPAIDLDDVFRRTRGFDPSDDPFYVIDLTTGAPVPLEMGNGSFPLTLVEQGKYWPNDPRLASNTLLFETKEEGAGLVPSQYAPALDTDFDGVIDHPNVLHPSGGDAAIEDVIPWYERETDTLLLRPIVPLDEMHEYAVVLTDRLEAPDGQPVRSPFENIHHVEQKSGAERVGAILGDAGARGYYGDVAGTGLSHVAFVWTFTTEPVADDMKRLRDGLHGTGPFAHLATEYPPTAQAFRAIGLALDAADEPPGGVDADADCAKFKRTPFIVRVADARDSVKQLLQTALGLSGGELDTLLASLDDVDHFVIGSFVSPYFLGDPKHEDPDGRFQVNYLNGQGRVVPDTVQFWLSVPKATAKAKQPFPVTVWAHGTTLHDDEIIVRAGYFAKQGVAMMGINMPGHGLYLTPGLEEVATIFLRQTCMVPWVRALEAGRDQDLNGDGVPDSGGLLWSAHLFHSRDNIRQSVVDMMQATRVMRGWDGVTKSDQDYDADGAPNLAGDFDGDGVPDVGGPNVPMYSAGNSFGGILAMVHGAVDDNVSAVASISGGGGLTDVATRSSLVPDSVLEQVYTPLVVGEPNGVIPQTSDGFPGTRCTGDQRSVRFVVNDLTVSSEVEIACLSPAELDKGKTIVLTNDRNGEVRCARSYLDGRFRIAIPANVGDRLDVQIYDAPDVVDSYKTCNATPGAPVGRRIATFEQQATRYTPVADSTKTCDAAAAAAGLDGASCAQFRDTFFPIGSPLVAPQEGLGLVRGSPDARRLFVLTQVAIDPADPINFARTYGLGGGPPKPIVEMNTAGDPFVPVAAGYAFGRAAGAVPFLPPGAGAALPAWAAYETPQALWDAMGGKSPSQALADSWTLEGVARMNRTHAGPACKANYVSSPSCTSPPSTDDCKDAVFDADWLAEGKNLWDAPHPAIPLRLARVAGAGLLPDAAWAPRLAGAPFAPDDAGWHGDAPLTSVIDTWIVPGGQHVFVDGDPCKAFDETEYYIRSLVRFLASGGRDLYFLSHPSTHTCMANESCPFFAE